MAAAGGLAYPSRFSKVGSTDADALGLPCCESGSKHGLQVKGRRRASARLRTACLGVPAIGGVINPPTIACELRWRLVRSRGFPALFHFWRLVLTSISFAGGLFMNLLLRGEKRFHCTVAVKTSSISLSVKQPVAGTS